jgi:hypothetical protein
MDFFRTRQKHFFFFWVYFKYEFKVVSIYEDIRDWIFLSLPYCLDLYTIHIGLLFLFVGSN